MDIIMDVFVSAQLWQCGTAHHMNILAVHERFNKTFSAIINHSKAKLTPEILLWYKHFPVADGYRMFLEWDG